MVAIYVKITLYKRKYLKKLIHKRKHGHYLKKKKKIIYIKTMFKIPEKINNHLWRNFFQKIDTGHFRIYFRQRSIRSLNIELI